MNKAVRSVNACYVYLFSVNIASAICCRLSSSGIARQLMSTPRRIFHVTSSPPPPSSTMSEYGMWSLQIPAFRAPSPPQTESPAPLSAGTNVDGHSGSTSVASAAAASPIFDARCLVVKREPPLVAPLLVSDAGLGAEVHGTTMLRRGCSAFGMVDVGDGGHQQPLPPAAVYHSFGPAVAPSPRLWTTESMAAVADEYDVSTGPRMASCSGGSLSGSDGSGRPQTSGVGSEDRSSASPITRVQPLNALDAATKSTSSNLLIGKPCIPTAYMPVGLYSVYMKAEIIKGCITEVRRPNGGNAAKKLTVGVTLALQT